MLYTQVYKIGNYCKLMHFELFVEESLLPVLNPFNGINTHSVVIMDNATIHHIDEVSDLVEGHAGAKLCYLPPYSPDLNPVEGIFSQVKSKSVNYFMPKSFFIKDIWYNYS